MLAAAGSAVGLGNIWRFPYLAAKDGGGTFILVYIVLALTFGFTLLTTDIAIGRKTGQSPLVAYGKIHPGWNGLGLLASIVPVVILPYYCSIGGWVLKYLSVFLTGHGTAAAEDGYFTGYITGTWQPIVWLGIYLFLTAFVVYRGVNKGIENYSKILMPILLILPEDSLQRTVEHERCCQLVGMSRFQPFVEITDRIVGCTVYHASEGNRDIMSCIGKLFVSANTFLSQ